MDVGDKSITQRVATASGHIEMLPSTLARIRDAANGSRSESDQAGSDKGNVIEVARLAGIMAAKQTGSLIPLCHPLPLDAVNLELEYLNESTLSIQATVRVTAKTGVEMEALTAVSVAALTVYDMCKSVDRSMRITNIQLDAKSGGRSGEYQRGDSPSAT